MDREAFHHEEQRLAYVLDYIDATLFAETPNETNLRQYIIEERRRIWDDYSQSPDNPDLMQANQTLDMDTERYFRIKDKLYFLGKMRDCPYFARIDFCEEGSSDVETFYIGALSLIDSRTYEILICDWRAEIASLFYDGALGPTEYTCQAGTIRGDISLRRQIKIEDAQLKYVFDNAINITDPILMEELGKNSDAKLKTVINTIQKEQNRVIRDLNADLLLVQGSAGSGKTSVALHRVAFLLYRNRKTLTSQDVMIFSPSEIFSAYIASVLPELGEENAVRTDFYHFLVDLNNAEVHYCDRSEQIEALLESNDSFLRKMISEKGSANFAERLERYYARRCSSFAVSEPIVCFDALLATAEELKQWFFADYVSYAPTQRVGKIITRVLDAAEDCKEEICRSFLDEASQYGILSFTDEEKAQQCEEMWNSSMAEISDKIKQMLLFDEAVLYLDFLKESYPDFYDYSAPLFDQHIIPYEDMLCISYLRVLSGSLSPSRTVRQVVVDEAQEHPPVVYLLLSKVFPVARFTILGDISQQVDAKIASISEIAAFFPEKKTVSSVELNKTYRSTKEINFFADQFRSGSTDFCAVERHGPAPEVLKIHDVEGQIKAIVDAYRADGCSTTMILCRTQRECDELYRKLRPVMPIVRLRSFDTFRSDSTVILPVYLSKGLEADGVIVSGVSEAWDTPEDRNLMYVAATRALHRLTILSDGEPPLLRP